LEGEEYRDDRLFVLYIARCHLEPPNEGMASCTIYHEEPQPPAAPDTQDLWCVVTYRNTGRYPISGLAHFRSRELADLYQEQIEPKTPLVSLGGHPMDPVLSYSEWSDLKRDHGWIDYDYNAMYLPGGTNPHEVVMMPASSVRIYSTKGQ
jgi:hypothetical protein